MTRPCICSAMSDRSHVSGSTSATSRGYNETVGAEAKHGFRNASSVSIHYIVPDSQKIPFAALCDCTCPPVIHARLRRRFGSGGQSMECASGKAGRSLLFLLQRQNTSPLSVYLDGTCLCWWMSMAQPLMVTNTVHASNGSGPNSRRRASIDHTL